MSDIEYEYEHIKFEIMVNDEDNTVYVKFAGFTDVESADEFADSLIQLLPLITHDSEVKH